MRLLLPGPGAIGALLVAFALMTGGPAAAQDATDVLGLLRFPGLAAILPPVAVVKFSTVNTDGTPVPCGLTLAKLRGVLAYAAPSRANTARFKDLQSRGIERCNANDDRRANDLLAEALGMIGH